MVVLALDGEDTAGHFFEHALEIELLVVELKLAFEVIFRLTFFDYFVSCVAMF